jgi:VWFA-related protein
MKRDRLRLLLFLLLLLGLPAITVAQSRRVPQAKPTPPPHEDDTERVETEEIKLNVVAFDDNGNFVGDVKESDLVITENNILHQPSSVRRIPANVLIVLDTGGEQRQVKNLDQTRRTARALVAALSPGDSIAIMQYSDTAEIVGEWTTDKAAASKMIGRTNFGHSSVFANALDLARDFFSKNPLENKHLVLISDGTDTMNGETAKKQAIQRLVATDISVHVISYSRMEVSDIAPRTKSVTNSAPPSAMPPEVVGTLPNGVRDVASAPKAKSINLDRKQLRSLRARKTDLQNSETQLDALAESTNGTAVNPETFDEMIDKTALIAKMIDASYAVTYIPKVPISNGTPSERNIQVTSRRPGLLVEARRKVAVSSGK